MLSPRERLVGAQLDRYIRDELYWVLHAPRQVGKTTFLQSWMREINDGSEAVACYVSVERCQGIGDADRAMPGIYGAVRKYAKDFGLPHKGLALLGQRRQFPDIVPRLHNKPLPRRHHLSRASKIVERSSCPLDAAHEAPNIVHRECSDLIAHQQGAHEAKAYNACQDYMDRWY